MLFCIAWPPATRNDYYTYTGMQKTESGGIGRVSKYSTLGGRTVSPFDHHIASDASSVLSWEDDTDFTALFHSTHLKLANLEVLQETVGTFCRTTADSPRTGISARNHNWTPHTHQVA